MKRRYIKFVMMLALAVGVMVAFWSVASATNGGEKGGDHSEADGCAGCHRGAGAFVMREVVAQWEASAHGNSYDNGSGANTYCASCKSPMVAVPGATRPGDPIAQEDWQDVTCSSCHPPHNKRVEWGTPIGTYNVATGEYTPVYDPNVLCVFCHTGSHHAKDFKGFGQSMYDKQEVKCNDCHMPEVPLEGASDGVIHSHTWEVEENLPYSCGVDGTGCHSNHTTKWAEKQINKTKIHDAGGNNPDKWPYYPGGESPP